MMFDGITDFALGPEMSIGLAVAVVLSGILPILFWRRYQGRMSEEDKRREAAFVLALRRAFQASISQESSDTRIESFRRTVIELTAKTFLGRGPRKTHPPRNASFLIYLFLPWEAAEVLVGDLEERFPRMKRKYGHHRAWMWYWFQTFISIRPILGRWLKQISGIAAVAELIRRKLG